MTASFDELKRNQPKKDDVLVSMTGEDVVLTEERREENGVLKRGVFCRAAVDVDRGGWFLSDKGIGLVCMVLPDSQKRLTRNADNKLVVRELRVVRYTSSGRAILAELVN